MSYFGSPKSEILKFHPLNLRLCFIKSRLWGLSGDAKHVRSAPTTRLKLVLKLWKNHDLTHQTILFHSEKGVCHLI